jgi:hypothetical protein
VEKEDGCQGEGDKVDHSFSISPVFRFSVSP